MTLPENWQSLENKLYRQFVFADFTEAFAFMMRVGFLAEKHNHHPNWCNSYKTVNIYLTTHEAGDIITEKDINLALAINKIITT